MEKEKIEKLDINKLARRSNTRSNRVCIRGMF